MTKAASLMAISPEISGIAETPVLAVGVEDGARAVGSTRDALYKAIAAGELVSFKLGKRRLILVKELEAWINRKAKEGAR